VEALLPTHGKGIATCVAPTKSGGLAAQRPDLASPSAKRIAKKDPAVYGRVPIAIFRGKEIDRDAVLPYQL
jgi:hypothetical protein